MQKSKKELDEQIRKLTSKLKTEKERGLRGLMFARRYYNINEFATAEKYLHLYLQYKEDDEQAYKYLGLVNLRLDKKDKALQFFQKSLQLNQKQPDILKEVCKILLEDKDVDTKKAEYWCHLAENVKVEDDSVFALRLKIMGNDKADTNAVEALLQKHIREKPDDVMSRVRLIQSFLDQNKVLEAFKYVHDFELTQNPMFSESSEWYNAVWLVLTKYEQVSNVKKDWNYWLLLIMCLERQIWISFKMASGISGNVGGSTTETANLLFSLDQYLFKISNMEDKLNVQKELFSFFMDHYRGQFLLHSVSLIIRKELLQNKNRWRETVQMILPLLLLAYQTQSVSKQKEPWMKHCRPDSVALIQIWQHEGAFRCAQAGRVLLSCIADEIDKENRSIQIHSTIFGTQSASLWNSSDDLLSQIRKTCADKNWRRNIFTWIFCNSDQKIKEQSSMFVKSVKLAEPNFDLPTHADIEEYETMAQFYKPYSLSHTVYLCIGNKHMENVRAAFFSALNFTTSNLAFCGAESLNQLDVDTFLYASTLQAKRSVEVDHETYDNYNSSNRSANGKPHILPYVNMLPFLCSEEQASWWMVAYKVYKNERCENLAESRAHLQFGIEAVRAINGPKMDLMIAFKLGHIFWLRSMDAEKPVEKGSLANRMEWLYRAALNQLRLHNRNILESFGRYFKYANNNSPAFEKELNDAAEEAIRCLGERMGKRGEYEELIELLNDLHLPFASYWQAEAYRRMAESNRTPNKNKHIYIERQNECLNQALSLLKDRECDPNHPLNSIVPSELRLAKQAIARTSSMGGGYLAIKNDAGASSLATNILHNNSSTYEDAETADSFFSQRLNHSVRESPQLNASIVALTTRNDELEKIIRDMAKMLSGLKDEIIDNIKPEMLSMRRDMGSIKSDISHLEDMMKKARISSNTPSHGNADDDASNVLDDFVIYEDVLNNQMYGGVSQQQQTAQQSGMYPNTGNGSLVGANNVGVGGPFGNMAPRPNGPPFNPSMFSSVNQYPMNFYQPSATPAPPYLMAQHGNLGPPSAPLFGARNQMPSYSFMDAASPMGMPQVAGTQMKPSNMMATPPNPLNVYQPVVNQQNNSTLLGLLNQPPANATNLSLQPQQNSKTHQVTMPPVQVPASSVPAVTSVFTPPQPQLSGLLSNTSTPIIGQFNKALNNQPVEKDPPANVVITSSDPLPNPNNVSAFQNQQPALSVTIPSHHIKSNVQQPQEQASTPAIASVGLTGTISSFPTFNFGSSTPQSSTTTTTTQSSSIFSGFNAPGNLFSGITSKPLGNFFSNSTTTSMATIDNTNTSSPFQDKTKNTFSSSFINENVNQSGDTTFGSEVDESVEYDPCPDFKPIIPLPDKIEVKTGEEDEEVKFCERAKLFRLVDKEWKERGIGQIKILKADDGKSRILMRRDQTHKICANHLIIKELILTEPKNETKGFIWGANDYADEEVKLEKFFVRFKTPEIAKKFGEAFKQAQREDADSVGKQSSSVPKTQNTAVKTSNSQEFKGFGSISSLSSTGSNVIGTVTHSTASPFIGISDSTSTAKPTLFDADTKSKSGAPTPFANFSFGKTTAAASPSVPTLSNVFSNLGKGTLASSTSAFSFTSSSFTTSTASSPFTTANTTANVSATGTTTDADEDDYVPTAQFQPVIPLPELVDVVTGEEDDIILFEHRAKLFRLDKAASEWKERGLGDIKLLQNKNDKNIVRLVMRREQIHKLCCNQRLYKDTEFKYGKNSKNSLIWVGQDFSDSEIQTETLMVRFKTEEICKRFFDAVSNVQKQMTAENNEGAEKSVGDKKAAGKEKTQTKGFGDAFKPKVGSWDCKACYINNPGDKQYCVACDSPKDDTVPKKEPTSILATNSQTKFTFGFGNAANTAPATSSPVSAFQFGTSSTPKSTSAESKTTTSNTTSSAVVAPSAGSGFGDKFKPKAGSWECPDCYVSNSSDLKYCSACDRPKDDTVPKKEQQSNKNILELSNPSLKFNFGFSQNTAPAEAPKATQSLPQFGIPQNKEDSSSVQVSKASSFGAITTSTSTPAFPAIGKSTFSFSMPMSSMGTATTTTTSSTTATDFSLNKKDFSFTLKGKSPSKTTATKLNGSTTNNDDGDGAGDDDNEYHEEENNTYFTPVIPLPDKIEVKTGEEDEDVLYVHRAKLYRFDAGEWKERGLGDVKILRHKLTKKLRVVMRREQVLKICLNHVLNKDVEYKSKDEKSWIFIVNDFSEGEMRMEKLTLRFKTAEIAQEFMKAVQNALNADGSSVGSSIIVSDEKIKPLNESMGSETKEIPFTEPIEKPLPPLEQPLRELPKSKPGQTENISSDSKKTDAESPGRPLLRQSALQVPAKSTESSGPISFSFTAAAAANSPSSADTNGSGGFLFGSSNNTNKNFASGSIFGGTSFGDVKHTFGQPSIFSGKGFTDQTTNDKPIFGTVTSSTKSDELKQADDNGTKSIFGTVTTSNGPKGNSLYGDKSSFASAISSSIPAATTTTPTLPVFGSVSSTNASNDFASLSKENKENANHGFAFGKKEATKVNGSSDNTKVNSTSTVSFADLANSSVVDFASLAAQAKTSDGLMSKSNEKPGPGGFIGLTGQNAFSNFSKAFNNNNKGFGALNKSSDSNTKDEHADDEEGGGDGADDNDNYDPYYAPIISLPKEIEVSTGEENEEKLFGQRAKLFRWDDTNKEWKERAVGELKLLKHRELNTYRLLMRREQVLKLVLNHAVNEDFEMKNMQNNPKSFVWGCMNFAESSEGVSEKLAVRFGKEEIAKQFHDQITACIADIKSRAAH